MTTLVGKRNDTTFDEIIVDDEIEVVDVLMSAEQRRFATAGSKHAMYVLNQNGVNAAVDIQALSCRYRQQCNCGRTGSILSLPITIQLRLYRLYLVATDSNSAVDDVQARSCRSR